MKEIWVRGGRRLEGEIWVHGAKNAALPILAATVLSKGESLLHNCPRLTDLDCALALLEHLGCRTRREGGDIWVDASEVTSGTLPRHLMEQMRSSLFFLGPLLARLGHCEFFAPGGCALGERPIDLHLGGFQSLGAVCREQGERLILESGGLQGAAIILPFPSVGATENLMMAALAARGTTVIYNAAREPEICDLARFLRAGGAKIAGDGTGLIQIEPGLPRGAEYRIMPDRMEAATYLCAGASAGGDLAVRGIEEELLLPVCKTLRNAGCQIRRDCAIIRSHSGDLGGCRLVRTAPYPGFPTDAQAVTMAALLRARGISVFEETVFSQRFRHVPALRALGADIRVSGSVAVVLGGAPLRGAAMEATDLRGGAAMVVAALGAEGESTVRRISHIERGYEALVPGLAALGAEIETREEAPAPREDGGWKHGLG